MHVGVRAKQEPTKEMHQPIMPKYQGGICRASNECLAYSHVELCIASAAYCSEAVEVGGMELVWRAFA